MSRSVRFAPVTLAVLITAMFGIAPAGAATDKSPVPAAEGRYVVRFANGADAPTEASALAGRGARVDRVYQHVFAGAVVRLSNQAAEALQHDPRVAAVEPDRPLEADGTQTNTPWGLDRTDQRNLPLSGTYAYPNTGAGVSAYIVDTGILASHADFGGRVRSGYTAVNDGNGTTDCNGHGTHVAGTVGGSTYGMAKGVSLVAVRVLDCSGSGSYSGVIAGLDWVAADHNVGQPAVLNLSLGGPASSLLDSAVNAVVADGVTVVVAAGNDGTDACLESPAQVPEAITVAATDRTDFSPNWSNWGTCLDLFAPGVSITSDWNTSVTATNTISGTSMAAPHVTGAAAVLLGSQPSLTPAAVASAIAANATPGHVTNAGTGSPNQLLYLSFAWSPSLTVPGSPTGVTASAGNASASVTWTAPADNGGATITSYSVMVYFDTTLLNTVTATGTSTTLTGLTNRTIYTLKVAASNAAGTGAASTASAAVTPAAPRSGYWMVGSDGAVYAFGDATPFGNAPVGAAQAVDLEPTPSGDGYWIVDDLGRVVPFGDAVARGNVDRSELAVGEKVTSLSATSSGNGYWIFTTRGRVLTFGDATFSGDVSNLALNGPVLDSITTPSGRGYYMVASDGGIFAFGDAQFYGSMGGKRLNAPVQSLVPDSDRVGYWLVASDGGIFAFDAPYQGSMGAIELNKPVTGMVRAGAGYLMVGEDGGIFDFSATPNSFKGSLGANPPAHPIASVAVLEER